MNSKKLDLSAIKELWLMIERLEASVAKLTLLVYNLERIVEHKEQLLLPSRNLRGVEMLDPFTIGAIKKRLDNNEYTKKMFDRCIDGLVEFFLPMMHQDGIFAYICTDTSRNICFRVDETNKWIRDDNNAFLKDAVTVLIPIIERYLTEAARNNTIGPKHENTSKKAFEHISEFYSRIITGVPPGLVRKLRKMLVINHIIEE